MERTYDLFEVEPNGVVRWRCAITGHEKAIQRLQEFAQDTKNEAHPNALDSRRHERLEGKDYVH